MLSSRVSTVEALVVFLDINNQLGLFQNNFHSNLEVFTRDTLIAIARYMDVGVCKVYLSGLDFETASSRKAGKALTRQALTIKQSKT